MQGLYRELIKGVLLSLTSLIVTLAALELVVFRYVLVPDDILHNVSINNVVRYQPDTHATFRHPDGTRTTVTINAQGWNSVRPYAIDKKPGRTRLAVVGDSYVHAAFVETSDAFTDVVERELQAAGTDVEVYRFGMDGAPLSQYLHMLRNEVLQYRPDVVLIPLIHNDFDESYRFLKTRYASSFLKLTTDEVGRIAEIPPHPFAEGKADLLRASATFRYLYYETGLYLAAKRWISKYVWGGDEDWEPEFISSAVDVRKIRDHEKNRLYARYVMTEMKSLAETHGFKLVFVMDGVREAVYSGRPPDSYEVGKLNLIASDLTRELDLPFLDLQSVFAADYARHKQRFEFPFDWHWDKRANALIGREIARMLLTDPRLLARPLAAAR